MGRPTTPPPIPPPPPSPPPAPPAADPLADLREGLDPAAIQENGPEVDPEPELVEVRAMVTQETWDEMVAEVVAAWHQDPTSQGFLHGGGTCGCLYIARHALRAAVPVMTEEDQEEHDLEPVNV